MIQYLGNLSIKKNEKTHKKQTKKWDKDIPPPLQSRNQEASHDPWWPTKRHNIRNFEADEKNPI